MCQPRSRSTFLIINENSLAQLEARYGIHVLIARDDTLIPPAFRLERLRSMEPGETPALLPAPLTQAPEIDEDEAEEDLDETTEGEEVERSEGDGEDERGRARRRRRRRRRHEDERGRAPLPAGEEQTEEPLVAEAAVSAMPEAEGDQDSDDDSDGGRGRRRRGRRGGRRRGRREDNGAIEIGRVAADTVEVVPTNGAAGDDGFFDESEPAAAAESAWSQSISAEPEPALATAATEIETASLPALAGDGALSMGPTSAIEEASGSVELTAPAETSPPMHDAPSMSPGNAAPLDESPVHYESLVRAESPVHDESPVHHESPVRAESSVHYEGSDHEKNPVREPSRSPFGEPQTASIEIVAASSEEAITSPSERGYGNGASPLGFSSSAEPIAEVPVAEAADQHPIEALRPVRDPETAVAPHSSPDEDTVSEPQSEPVLVQEVTKKPENPRRGWWQRLIQS